MNDIWEAFSELGSEVVVHITCDCGTFRGQVTWVADGEDKSTSLAFDEALYDNNFILFMAELLFQAR